MIELYLRNCEQSIKGVFTRTLKRIIGPYRKRRKWLEQTQWYSGQELERLQLGLLRDMIEHAYRTVPYYRRYMDKNKFKPQDIRSLDDIHRFPILTKQDLRTAGAELYSARYPSFLTKVAYTGGTTGMRIELLRDLWSIGNEHAFARRQFDWAGLSTRDGCAYMSWRIVCPPGHHSSYPYYYNAAMKELILSTFHLSPSIVPVYLEALKKYKIQALIGYPSAISTLARYALLENKKLPLKAVLTTSETSEPTRREQISEAFSCPVFDFYGSSERVCYIQSCPAGSYHIVPEYGLTELHEVPGQPELRKIVATGFWNKAMPLIRYDTGDLVIPSEKKCSCQRAYPCVEKIVGREYHTLVTPSGRELGPTTLECMMEAILFGLKGMPILEAQMVLHDGYCLTLEYMSSRDLQPAEEKKVGDLIASHIPNDFTIQTKRVSAIRLTTSGKALSFVLKTT